MLSLRSSLLILLLSFTGAITCLPSKIYGVNIGGWLIIEPWMLPAEWAAMGGENCGGCTMCIRSEFAFAKAHPDTVDSVFAKHWSSWFTQNDVKQLQDAGINTVRIPLGYWIVEPLVDRQNEYYPKGGLAYLRDGLKMLNDAGINVILDHHALPGVQSPNQMFTGRCTSDVEFYTPYNYRRALVWTVVMAAFSHLDPVFESVVAIEAVNEPISDASETPGYGDFQKYFVLAVRAVEMTLGIPAIRFASQTRSQSFNFTEALLRTAQSGQYPNEVNGAINQAASILPQIFPGINEKTMDNTSRQLTTVLMDISWQHGNSPNPADAAMGPQSYDNHLYYSFGGVADPTEEAYLSSICNLNRVRDDSKYGNSPLVFGEWALSTQFAASDSFLRKWADAQKFAYSRGGGWMFWNFKIEISSQDNQTARQWSYQEGLKRGYLTKDPSVLNDPHVCDPYIR